MNAPPHSVLEAARTSAGMSFADLWIAYFALGGAVQPDVVRAYLNGSDVGPFDYDVLAHAINERYMDQGLGHPVPYSDELD